MAYEIQGKTFKLAPPTIGRIKQIEQLGESIDDLIEAARICLDGPVDEVNWEDVDVRVIMRAQADFLSQFNKTAAEQMKRLTGLTEKTPS